MGNTKSQEVSHEQLPITEEEIIGFTNYHKVRDYIQFDLIQNGVFKKRFSVDDPALAAIMTLEKNWKTNLRVSNEFLQENPNDGGTKEVKSPLEGLPRINKRGRSRKEHNFRPRKLKTIVKGPNRGRKVGVKNLTRSKLLKKNNLHKRPVSSFMIFYKRNRDSIVSSLETGATIESISRKASDIWHSLPDEVSEKYRIESKANMKRWKEERNALKYETVNRPIQHRPTEEQYRVMEINDDGKIILNEIKNQQNDEFQQVGNTINRPRPILKKVKAKLQQRPVLQRAALKGVVHKKLATTTSLQIKERSRDKENENVIHTALPYKQKPKKIEEIMQVDDFVEDIDSGDSHNPQLVSAYVNDIYKYLWELEEKHCIKVNNPEGQKITHEMRADLIDWLVQVHSRFTLLEETLYLTVAIIDRYLMCQTVRTTRNENLQLGLVGVTALLIASKYEEMYIPKVEHFALITENTFSKEDICKMEVYMLNSLNCYISFPLPLHFLRRNSKAGHFDAAHHTLAKYLMEQTLLDYELSHCKPSKLAAAALFLSMKILNESSTWNDTLTYYSKYSEKDIMHSVCKLAALVIKRSTSKQQAINAKYKTQKLMNVSDISALRPPFCNVIKQYAAMAP